MRASRMFHPVTFVRPAAAALAVIVAALVATPTVGYAHARLRRSEPAAGAAVDAPIAIRLWFTESPELALTRITLLDSTGASVDVGVVEREPEGAMGVRVAVARALTPGAYTIRWSTAAPDGHRSSGTIAFRVRGAAPSTRLERAAPALPPAEPAARASDDASVSVGAIIARAFWLAAAIVLIGAVVFRLFVVARTDARGASSVASVDARVAGGACIASIVFLVAAVARLLLQTRAMRAQLPSEAPMHTLLTQTEWGNMWHLQIAAGVLALVGFLLARRGRAGWIVAGIAGIVIACAAAGSGHAAGDAHLAGFAVADDALHILAASAWLGALFWVVVAGTAIRPSAEQGAAARVAALVHAFSPIALACASLVALTGVVSAWLRLGSVSALWTSSYGLVLLFKLALVAFAATLGWYNWRRLRPTLGVDAATARLRRSATSELAIGAAIVLVTAVLVGMPVPI